MYEGPTDEEQNPLNKKLSEIEPIEEWRGTEIKNKEDLNGLIEAPLLTSCQELYDKNIRTTGSSANKKDLENGFAYININFDTLSENNKQIGKSIGEVFFADESNQLQIKIPVNAETTFGEIQNKAEEIAHQFVKQQYLVVTYTLEDVKNFSGIDPDDESFGPESFPEYYWSPKHKLFFISEEQFLKASEHVEE